MRRVPRWVWWTLGVAAAGGVGYLVLRPSSSTATPAPPGNGTFPPPLLPPSGTRPGQIGVPEQAPKLPDLEGYTDFFTPESEHLVTGSLEGWKIANDVTDCTAVEYWDAESQKMLIEYFEEARSATIAVLNEHYPLDAGQSWAYDTPGQPEWARWLFDRVELVAQRVVCGFEPIT